MNNVLFILSIEMFLRKKVPDLYDLSIEEIKNIISYTASSYDALIENIRQDLNIRTTLYDELLGKSGHYYLTELIFQTIDKLSTEEMAIFRGNFFQRLTNYPEFVRQQINFIGIENRKIHYFVLYTPSYFKPNDYRAMAMSYQYAGNKWYKISSPLQMKGIHSYEKVRNIIIVLHCIMIINQFEIDDSKLIIKDFCFLVNNVSKTNQIRFL